MGVDLTKKVAVDLVSDELAIIQRSKRVGAVLHYSE